MKLTLNRKFKGQTYTIGDLSIDGKKISGNAQCMHGDRVLHHGTLLFSASIADLSEALRSELAPSVIDGWMGHEEIGESIFGRHSCLSIQTLQHVADLIEAHLNFHQIEARAGWQIL